VLSEITKLPQDVVKAVTLDQEKSSKGIQQHSANSALLFAAPCTGMWKQGSL